jgi:heme exporter protein D
MDALIGVLWDALGFLWRIAIVVVPIAFLLWAALKGRRADLRDVEQRKAGIASRDVTSPPQQIPPVR